MCCPVLGDLGLAFLVRGPALADDDRIRPRQELASVVHLECAFGMDTAHMGHLVVLRRMDSESCTVDPSTLCHGDDAG